ncbi:MAG TPA: FMN-binding negative transcriptional regulator [Alphaproteobacteria bacterium]|nr:FMN-binding negative transcriptional regulator [Alphaproteobacteria bacterium]
MYTPAAFRFDELAEQHAAIVAIGFATLVVHDADGFAAVPLPVTLDPAAGPLGTLRAHVARANPIWKRLDGAAALLIVQGPHGYVSPDWYETPLQVPTWNYLTLHLHGTVRLLDAAGTRQMLVDLSAVHEARLLPKTPWTLDKMPETAVDGLQRAIVGLEIPLDRIEGKAKLSQNRKEVDRAGVVAGLKGRPDGDPGSRELAALMERLG